MGTRGGAVFCQAATWFFGSVARVSAETRGKVPLQRLAFGASVRVDLVNGALFLVCSCADGTEAPGAHLLAPERMVAKKQAPQHTILVCAMSATPGQATSRGARGPGGGDPAAGQGWGTGRRLQGSWAPRAVTEGCVGMFPKAAGEAARDGNFPCRGENSQQVGDRPGGDRAVRRESTRCKT